MQRQIVTISENLGPWFEQYSLPRMKDAAGRWGAALSVITPTQRMGVLGQMCMADAAKNADRTLYVDADCLIARSAPNPFERFPAGSLYAAIDSKAGDMLCFHRAMDIISVQAIMGSIQWCSVYFNAGLVLCDREHAGAWDEFRLMPLAFPGQTFINYRARKLGYRIVAIPWQWNAMEINTPEGAKQSEAFIAHAAGIYHEKRERWMAQMDRELP